MTTDLHFPQNGLSICVSIFYVTYVIFETPATALLKTLRPSRLIPTIVLVWGGISIGNGFAQNYATVLACRLLLGMCEAAFSPCLILYMTMFYSRYELSLRSEYSLVFGCLSAAGSHTRL
jgi:MFS family permease